MCGAVRFEAEPEERESHACHCEMCRRWSGSALVVVAVREGEMRFESRDAIRVVQSSDWAERAWCDRCGGNLYYRVTAAGPEQGKYHVALGTFDEPDAFPLGTEIYIDRKPTSFAFAGERKRLTEAQVEAFFAAPEGE